MPFVFPVLNQLRFLHGPESFAPAVWAISARPIGQISANSAELAYVIEASPSGPAPKQSGPKLPTTPSKPTGKMRHKMAPIIAAGI